MRLQICRILSPVITRPTAPADRDKLSLDIFWLRDDNLEHTANLPEPDILAAEIVEELEAALARFREIVKNNGEW